MNYSDFIKAIQKMGTGFPIPNLGMRTRNGRLCFFTVFVENGHLYIRNKFGENSPFQITEDFYYRVLEHFSRATNKSRFKLSYYTDPEWTSAEGNPSRIYAGYLPALFRELYARIGVSVVKDTTIWEEFSYSPNEIKELSIGTEYNCFLKKLDTLKENPAVKELLQKYNIKITHVDDKLVISDGKNKQFFNLNKFNSIKKSIEGNKYNSWFSKLLFLKFGKKLGEVIERILIEILIAIITSIIK